MDVRVGKKSEVKSKNLLDLISENQLAIFLVAAGVMIRVLPVLLTGHLGNNFAPVAAIALFGGTYLKKRDAVWLPLLTMMLSDVIIGYHSLIPLTWGSFALIGLMGLWLKGNKTALNVGVAALSGSLLFFFATNFGVWAFTPLYAKTAQGLLDCYAMAIPFFRNTLLGDLFYTGVMFGSFEMVRSLVWKKEPVRVI